MTTSSEKSKARVIDARGETIAEFNDMETAEKFAQLCADGGDTVRVVEAGRKRGKTYRRVAAILET